MADEPRGGVLHRLAELEKANERTEELCAENGRRLERHEEQISGERGLTKAMLALAEEIAGLRRMGWAIVAVFVAAVLAYGFGGTP